MFLSPLEVVAFCNTHAEERVRWGRPPRPARVWIAGRQFTRTLRS